MVAEIVGMPVEPKVVPGISGSSTFRLVELSSSSVEQRSLTYPLCSLKVHLWGRFNGVLGVVAT